MKTLLFTLVIGFTNLATINAQSPNNMASAARAHSQMGVYQLWTAMLPDSIHWNQEDSTIHYVSKKLDPELDGAFEKLNSMIAAYRCENNRTDNTFPYSIPDNYAQSFYISKRDFQIVDSLMKDTEFNGYRLYLTVNQISVTDPSEIAPSLYLGPATRTVESDTTIYTDPPIYIDSNNHREQVYVNLILPCPNGCSTAFGSEINNINIKVCESEDEENK